MAFPFDFYELDCTLSEGGSVKLNEVNEEKRLQLHIISHTHWDREWYQAFQGFRKRLVYMMDELLDVMEADPNYQYFHLDGQTIMLEDYLQIRPENEARLRKLVQEGRIMIGPWYVMPDEFLVSGESLARNLQRGFAISAEYDVEPMRIGYVTDIFGHNSQFPQILNHFGIDSALLYRGIGDYEKDTFEWEGADGSRVLAMKMDRERSYSNFYFALRRPFEGREYELDELAERLQQLLDFSQPLAVSEHLLMMDGVDHCEIEPRLPELISAIQERFPQLAIRQGRLEDYVAAQRAANLQLDTIKGELYEVAFRGINNQVLKNVLSSMVHLKQMNNACETLLTRWTEPFEQIASLIRPQRTAGFMAEAWKYLLQNHPHDSICGCSITRVHQDNEYRFRQTEDIGSDLLGQYVQQIVDAIDTQQLGTPQALVLFNASQVSHDGIVQAELEFPAGSQGIFKLQDSSGEEIPYQLLHVRKNATRKVVAFRKLIEFVQKDVYTIAFHARIPALGYVAYGYEEFRNVYPSQGDYSFPEYYSPIRYSGTMQIGHRIWDNGCIRVTIERDGTLCVKHHASGKEYNDLLLFEDAADVGDGWNYRKPVRDSKVLSLGSDASFSVEYEGPFAVQWKITHELLVPARIHPNGLERAEAMERMKIVTLVTMKKDSTVLEFKTTIDNHIADHRVRVLFPTYLQAERFYATTPFYFQEREVARPQRDRHTEVDTGVYPNQGAVLVRDQHSGVALYNKGLYEVEVTEDASRTIALTLFRSFRNEVARDEGEMSFMFRSMAFEFALDFRESTDPLGDIVTAGEGWRSGLHMLCKGAHGGQWPELQQSFLNVDIPGAILSAWKSGADGMSIVRLYNCTDQPISGTVELMHAPVEVLRLNLNEEVGGILPHEGRSVRLKMAPAEILTFGYKG